MPRLKLFIFTLIRTAINTAHRMIYPFVSTFARALGVDVNTVTLLLANRGLFGALAPLAFPFIETRGRRFGMLLGLGFFVSAMSLTAFWPSLTTLGISLILAVLGKAFFDPSMAAYLSDEIPYQRRGTAIAITEFGWSLAFIFGIPAMAFLISKFDWSAPFKVLAVLAALALLFVFYNIRDVHMPAHHADGVLGNLRAILTSAPVMVAFSIGLCASAANELVNIVFGVWLEDSFQLKIAALAGASAVIGISELGGEGLVALVSDRLGKVRAVALGLVLNCLAAALLPIIGHTQTGALAGLFLFYFTFEFIMVSQISMMSEVMPLARATTLAFNGATQSLGRALGALATTSLYALGFSHVTATAIGMNLLGLAAVWYVSRHHE